MLVVRTVMSNAERWLKENFRECIKVLYYLTIKAPKVLFNVAYGLCLPAGSIVGKGLSGIIKQQLRFPLLYRSKYLTDVAFIKCLFTLLVVENGIYKYAFLLYGFLVKYFLSLIA